MNKRPMDTVAVQTMLDLAMEKHPNASIVYSRWGDFYLKLGRKDDAIRSYRKAAALDPADQQVKDILSGLAD